MISELFGSKKEILRLITLDEEKQKQLAEKDKIIAEMQAREAALYAIKSALEGSSAAIMMVDRDFIVTYVNEASMTLFKDNAAEFKTAFPSFDPNKIVGACIDAFHKHPEQQRKMLTNTSVLPFKSDIRVGDLMIGLYVTATYSQTGEYTGNVLEWRDLTEIRRKELADAEAVGQLAAIKKGQGVIEFDLTGNVTAVNENFAAVTGYSANEIVGNHHSMFVDSSYKASAEYKAFWDKLGRGEADSGQYKRIGKGGKEIWLQASYNPIMDMNGKPFKVVKYATDITEQKIKNADFEGQITAIKKAQGMVEIGFDGTMLSANEIYLNMLGYSEKELVGQNVSIVLDPVFFKSPAYTELWEKLTKGGSDAGQYKRIGKGGKEVWIQASYNTINDANGKPYKIVNYTLDITEQHNNAKALETAVEETQGVIEGAKSGDLTSRVSLEGKTGAIASLCDGVNALMDKMTEVILQVREAGDTINTAAGEISSGNTDLSSRTEQQASSLEETASSMEELASTVKQNAENAKQANQLAAAASSVAVKGGEVVGQVVNTMSAINNSAKKIEDIISVIDGIAFQTNILALNAAVEAARAGEQGRGFAVVAGEVRNLAQRSASAAKEIKELITDSVNKTAEGTVQVENAGKTMQEIVSSVQRVTDIMGEIAAASSEQSAGIDQVNNSITSMDEVTQQNAALVEEAAAAAESLVDQAESLIDVVSAFKLSGGQATSASKSSSNRRVASSPMRAAVTAPEKSEKPASVKSKTMAKTGTDDSGDWEEF